MPNCTLTDLLVEAVAAEDELREPRVEEVVDGGRVQLLARHGTVDLRDGKELQLIIFRRFCRLLGLFYLSPGYFLSNIFI